MHLLLVVALASMLAMPSALADTIEYRGTAIDPSSHRVLYRETHIVQRDNGRQNLRVVLYQCSDGTTFARKRVDYTASAIAPDFELIDARDGYREGVRRAHGRIVAFAGVGAQGARNAALTPGATLVADAGFDAFVDSNWNALLAGRTLALQFTVPAKGKAYDFKLGKQATTVIDGVPAVVFRLQMGGLLSLFAPHIDVAYAIATHQLLRFTGITNIRHAAGRQIVAQIDFPAAAPTAVAPSTLQNAMALPMHACRVTF
ncbi:MAG: hypothetical protein ABIT64_01605 [Lysobacteraceae bacterium]